jgi:hypothetical protein
MNIGFKSEEKAQEEIDSLVRNYEKRWAKHTDEEIINMHLAGIKMYVQMIGREYKVEPIKLSPM